MTKLSQDSSFEFSIA